MRREFDLQAVKGCCREPWQAGSQTGRRVLEKISMITRSHPGNWSSASEWMDTVKYSTCRLFVLFVSV